MNQLNIPFIYFEYIEIRHHNYEILESIISGIEDIGVKCERNLTNPSVAYIRTSDNKDLTEHQVKKLSEDLYGFPTSIELKMTIANKYSQDTTIQ